MSLALHLGLIWAFTISSASEFSDMTIEGEGQTDSQGLQIDLLNVHDSAKAIAARPTLPSKSTPFDDFRDMTLPAPLDTPVAPDATPDAASIQEALGENPFLANQNADAPRSSTEAHVKTSDDSRQTPNDLWRQIAPCWNRIADQNSLAVTLEVSFTPLGKLSKPPSIKRDASMPLSDRMLRSESQAISALSECGPYLMAFGKNHVQVNFPKL